MGATRPSFVLLAAVAALSAPEECPDCVPGKNQARLCEPHAAREDEVLPAAERALRSDDPEVRTDALRRVAALTEEHDNAPSTAVVKALARGLKDDSYRVQLVAVELLASQHPEAALVALGSFVKAHVKRFEKAVKRRSELDYERQLRDLQSDPEDRSARERASAQREAAELESLAQEIEALDAITDALGGALGGFADGRSIAALEPLLEAWSRPALVAALVTLGNVEAAELLVDRLTRDVEAWGPVQKVADAQADRDGQEEAVAALLEVAAGLEERVRAVHEGLAQIARAAGNTEGLPAMGLEVAERWREWLRGHGKSLPPAFRRMAMPWARDD